MADKSLIEWTESTWNVWYGCTKVSPACARCYIERTPPFRIAGLRFDKGRIPLVFMPERLEIPLRWRRARTIFVNSLSDTFHEDVPDDYLKRLFAVMLAAEWHTFQVLTKRPRRMLDFVTRWGEIPRNVWYGVTVENQRMATERTPLLLQTPAAVRWLSVEPILGFLDLSQWLDKLDWVVVGGESGIGHRTLNLDWVRIVRDQCIEAGVPFFFKQVGGIRPTSGGRLLDGRTWDDTPRTRAVGARLAARFC